MCNATYGMLQIPPTNKPLTDVASKILVVKSQAKRRLNLLFACDLTTAEYDEQLPYAIITLATSDRPCTCDGASEMVYLR